MPYRFSRQRLDYSDFASGRVFRSLPGRTAFPVRLADELFQRCLALRPTERRAEPVVLYDPCCGGASLLCTLALLHWQSIRRIVASDADAEALALAGRNLALLTLEGIAERRREIAALHAGYGKDSHAEALHSVDRLAVRLDALVQHQPLPTRLFLADALAPASLAPHLEPRSIDVVIADVPHGQRTHWLDAQAPQDGPDEPDGSTTIWRLLEALRPALAPDAVLAIVGDKSQRAHHEQYAPAGNAPDWEAPRDIPYRESRLRLIASFRPWPETHPGGRLAVSAGNARESRNGRSGRRDSVYPQSAPDRRRPARAAADLEELLVMDLTSRPPLAGIPVRFAAFLLDGIVLSLIFIPFGIVAWIVSLSFPALPGDTMQIIAIFILLLTSVGISSYSATVLALWAYGLTPGKWMLGIRVVKRDTGSPAGFWRMALRQTIGQWVSAILCYLGFIWAMVDANRQGWHDKIARTLVLRTR